MWQKYLAKQMWKNYINACTSTYAAVVPWPAAASHAYILNTILNIYNGDLRLVLQLFVSHITLIMQKRGDNRFEYWQW